MRLEQGGYFNDGDSLFYSLADVDSQISIGRRWYAKVLVDTLFPTHPNDTDLEELAWNLHRGEPLDQPSLESLTQRRNTEMWATYYPNFLETDSIPIPCLLGELIDRTVIHVGTLSLEEEPEFDLN